MTQKDQFLSDNDIDGLLLGVDEIFEKGGAVAFAELKASDLLPIDEEEVDSLVNDQAMSEADARKYVHDARHLMRALGSPDTTKINFSLLK